MAANRVKTVEYMLPNLLSQVACAVSAGSYTDSTDLTVYIPETTDRTILSARIEAYAYNSAYANSSNPSGWGIRCSCDGGSNWTAITQAALFSESDENFGLLMVADVTAEFTARFSGASDTVRWGYYITANNTSSAFANVSAKLIITYEYDDSAHATRVKTVHIPIESYNGRISTSYVAIKQTSTASNQIPQLTGSGSPLLPEASVTVRQAYLELWSNTMPNATTDAAITLRIDAAGSTQAYTTIDNTQDSATAIRLMWDITSEDLTAAHELYAIMSASSGNFAHLGGWLTVTYEYDHSSSSTILNSLLMGLGEDLTNVDVVGNKSYTSIERFIQEPDTITLKQSGIWVTMGGGATSTTFSIGCGSQTPTGYTPMADGQNAGMLSIVHRVDSGAHASTGIAAARGLNTWTAQWYAANANRLGNVSIMLIINYTSGKHTNGDGVHAHSVYFPLLASNRNAATVVSGTAVVVPKIISSDYWLLAVNPLVYASGLGAVAESLTLEVERVSTSGFETLFATAAIGQAENGCWISNGVCRSQFKRWPNDTDSSRMDIEGDRLWKIQGTSKQYGLGIWVTWHEITYSISGTVTGYTGDGSGITVEAHRSDTDEKIGTATTAIGGTYSITWYDNTIDVYSHAIQDGTHLGRSDDGVAV